MELWRKYKEIILYIFFGGLTTLVNIIGYYFLSRIINIDYLTSNVIAWFCSVVFAYLTNKIWVFEKKIYTFRYVCKEFTWFFACRLFSGGLDMSFMWLGVTVLKLNDLLVKIWTNIVVIIVNYLFSKLIIFKKDVG